MLQEHWYLAGRFPCGWIGEAITSITARCLALGSWLIPPGRASAGVRGDMATTVRRTECVWECVRGRPRESKRAAQCQHRERWRNGAEYGSSGGLLWKHGYACRYEATPIDGIGNAIGDSLAAGRQPRSAGLVELDDESAASRQVVH